VVRQITPEIRGDLRSQYSPHSLIAFVTITHENLPSAVRLVSDPLDFVVGGELYIGCPFDYRTLTDGDQSPTTTIRVQNVDRRIGEAVRVVPLRAVVALEARSTADFDLSVVPRAELSSSSVIYGFSYFELTDVTSNALEIKGTLSLRDFSQEPWPGKRATMARCPALFR